ncbi:hypothetical protein EJB05_43260, partial [Eragrostis curvula]
MGGASHAREKAAPRPPLGCSKDGVLLVVVLPRAVGTSTSKKVSVVDGAAQMPSGGHHGAGFHHPWDSALECVVPVLYPLQMVCWIRIHKGLLITRCMI